MKFTKKLLTVLPMATIGCITPIVVSGCSCSNSYTINYGDTINCKNKDGKDYHSIEDVKNSSKTHIQVLEDISMTQDQLNKFTFSANPQFFYWDLVYSCANNNMAYTLTWTFNDEAKKQFKEGNFNGTQFTTLNYVFNENNKVAIQFNGTTLVESFSYHCVKKA